MNSKMEKRVLAAAAGVDTVSDRFHSALTTFDGGNKPDSKDADLGSPVSPLRARDAVTNTSSSSSSSGSITGRAGSNAIVKKSDGKSHSGELLGSGDVVPAGADGAGQGTLWNWKPGHRRSGSGPLIFSGGGSGGSGSSATSPVANVLPAGNICPSGKIVKTGMTSRSTERSDVLRSGTGNYGHGSIMRGGAGAVRPAAELTALAASSADAMAAAARRAMLSMDPEEVKRAGNEQYKRGHFMNALMLYDRAISMCPGNAACHGNRAAALIGMGRLAEAAGECEEALRLDPAYWRAHQRLVSLYLRLGQVENARRHMLSAGQQVDHVELQKLQAIERHVNRCANARKIGDWKSALRESDAAIAAGADSSLMLIASRAEALLWLNRLEEADIVLSNNLKFEDSFTSCSQTTFGMLSNSYLYFVRARVEMALGRFENAVSFAERAGRIDPQNIEIATVLANVRSVAKARSQGNELFHSGRFMEACTAYGEGLKFDPYNPVLYCNRAACLSKLGQWEKSIEDCTEALRIHPNYTKALLRRATSNTKLERWAEAVHDYEVLRKGLPGDNEVAEALFHAQIALKKARGEEVSNLKFGGEVEEILGLEQFQAAISPHGVSVVHFMAALNQQCLQISPFVDTLCKRYPSVNFLKVDVDENPEVANAEDVRMVPTFKIYKNGAKVKEMICPSRQVLECSVGHYGL